VTATPGVIGPLWVSNAAGTTITSVVVEIGGAFGPGFVVAADGLATEAGVLAPRFAAGLAAGLAAGFTADLELDARFAAGPAAGFAGALAATLAAGFVADFGAAPAAGFATLVAAFAGAVDRVVFEALDRVVRRFGAVADRRRVVLDPGPVDPVDVSSAIAFSSGGTPVHCPSAPVRSCGNAC
jgi:hypothetical protein